MALTPLLVAIAGHGRALRGGVAGRGFGYGLLTGAVYFAGTLYWTADVMVAFGGLPRPAAVPIAGLLVAYLSIYPAVAGWVHRACCRAAAGLRALWLAPVAWTGTEFLRGYLFTGFPWVALGYSQARCCPSRNSPASAASPPCRGSWSTVVHRGGARQSWPAGGKRLRAPSRAPLLVVASVAAWGQWRIVARRDCRATRRRSRVGIVQGNIAQEQKWDPAFSATILHRYSTRAARWHATGRA